MEDITGILSGPAAASSSNNNLPLARLAETVLVTQLTAVFNRTVSGDEIAGRDQSLAAWWRRALSMCIVPSSWGGWRL